MDRTSGVYGRGCACTCEKDPLRETLESDRNSDLPAGDADSMFGASGGAEAGGGGGGGGEAKAGFSCQNLSIFAAVCILLQVSAVIIRGYNTLT